MKIKNNKFYFIRHKPTGLIKVGGHNSRFNKTGKLWLGVRIKNHLNMFKNWPKFSTTIIEGLNYMWRRSNFRPEDCEIIEVEFKEISSQPLIDFIEEEMNND